MHHLTSHKHFFHYERIKENYRRINKLIVSLEGSRAIKIEKAYKNEIVNLTLK